ncbi:polyprenyl synthetase family protein [Streptomyces montanisoli]|uniref:Polyprenyl synthetase family protein n=1 Tax=Streptomyces montanisoli TaxID=2798581 RepID=A0A940MCP2_9ACTN|nr:polyprenyl synthetase family protein [Streptomyces montanisoli]MBP0460559.1 polyprenyl synthetase family protein [Streptomyces montanisoli]
MRDDLALRRRIDAYLHQLVDDEEAELVRLSPELRPLCDQLRSSLTRGKRMRAAFLYWGWRAAGQPDCDGVIRAAAAMELVHAAACTHDDIIDDSRLRHGLPTAHVAFAEAGAGPWGMGDSHFESVELARPNPVPHTPVRQEKSAALAMMLGDLLIGYAAQVFATCGLPGAYVARTVPLWSTLLRETVAGEFLEVLRTGSETAEVAESLEVARYKTAKYTVERPLHMGATLGGASRQVMEAFTSYGVPLGEAFQLRDDLIGTFGVPAETGKSNLDDLRDRKPTALLATTLSLLAPDGRRLLEKTLDNPALDEDDAALVRQLMDECGARRRIEEMIAERVSAARSALDTVALPLQARSALLGLATSAAERAL